MTSQLRPQPMVTANKPVSPMQQQPPGPPPIVAPYPSQTKGGQGEPPMLVGATGSSAFQPLHSVSSLGANKPPSHTGSHNTSTSSFTPLHMIQPDHPGYPGGPQHNMSTASSEMYPHPGGGYPPKKTSRSSTPAGSMSGYYGNPPQYYDQRPSSRTSKSSSVTGGPGGPPGVNSSAVYPGGRSGGQQYSGSGAGKQRRV